MRESAIIPGHYKATVKATGDLSAAWVIPQVIDKEIEIRAGEDIPVEVRLDPGGMV